MSTRPADRSSCEPQRAVAADGARIALKRKHGEGCPVIFVHGLAVNADLWDIPPIDAPGLRFRSLPAVLQKAGYDVWLMNLRGHGSPPTHSEPPAGQRDYCVDHFVLFDLPAVVDHVRRVTGRRPFVIGNSMGAMTTAGWLEGTRLLGEDAEGRLVADAEAARVRNGAVAGVVLVEFPAALRWPRSLYDERGNLRWNDLLSAWRAHDADMNGSFEILARAGWLQAILQAAGEVRLDWLRPRPDTQPWWAGLPRPVAEIFERMNEALLAGVSRFLVHHKGHVANFHRETLRQGLLPAVDHMKVGVLLQLAKSVRARSFVSWLGHPDHDYTRHYGNITTRTLVVMGGLDRIANADVTRDVFFQRIASADKTFYRFEGLAHGDFEYAPAACRRVYPVIRAWLDARRAYCRRGAAVGPGAPREGANPTARV